MKNENNTVSLAIPFSGFYESWHADSIDREIESMFDREGNGEGEIPDDWHRFCDYEAIHEAYAKAYVDWFNEELKKESGIDFELEFESLESPREYNFRTDRIFCKMPVGKARELVGLVSSGRVPNSTLAEVLKQRHTSRSGFISSYSNRLEDWLELEFEELDNIHFESYLLALLSEIGLIDESFELEFIEDFICSGRLGNAICENAGAECLAMINGEYHPE